MDLALNNLQKLMRHKSQTNQMYWMVNSAQFPFFLFFFGKGLLGRLCVITTNLGYHFFFIVVTSSSENYDTAE